MPYKIEQLSSALTRISLSQPSFVPAPFDVAPNVYVLQGLSLGAVLVNTGHASSAPGLRAALDSLGLDLGRVRAVVITGAWPDLYGGVHLFPNAQVFAPMSRSEMVQHVSQRRDELLAVERQLFDPTHPFRSIDGLVSRYLIAPPTTLETTLIAPGDSLFDDTFRVEVGEGSLSDGLVLVSEEGLAFSGDLVQGSSELCWVLDPEALFASLHGLLDRAPRRVAPNRGELHPTDYRSIVRMLRLMSGFSANVEKALDSLGNAEELARADGGNRGSSAELLARVRAYDVLVRSIRGDDS